MAKTLNIFQHVLIAAWLALFSWPAQAADHVYQAPEDFVAEIFPLKPQAKTLWLSKEAQAGVTASSFQYLEPSDLIASVTGGVVITGLVLRDASGSLTTTLCSS